MVTGLLSNVLLMHTFSYINQLAVKRIVGRARSFSYNRIQMRKDAPLAFRIPTELKKRLLKLARQEDRSLSQTCEMLLRIGVDEYDKEGHKHLQKFLVSIRSGDQE
jgi:predicted DNA-binding protein